MAPEEISQWAFRVLFFILVIGLIVLVYRKAIFESNTVARMFLFGRPEKDDPNIPMLLICGDEAFCEDDEAQLNRARIWFRKLEHATLKMIDKELQRRRIDGSFYRWLHLSAHGNSEGFLLAEGDMMTPQWAADHFEGIQVVFAASCESVDAGDSLAGIVDAVVTVYGKRASSLVSTFACVFWREMNDTNNVRQAYRLALSEVPTLRPFVDLRVRQ